MDSVLPSVNELPAGDADGLSKVLAADGALETGLGWFEVLETAGVVEWFVRDGGFFPVSISVGVGCCPCEGVPCLFGSHGLCALVVVRCE